VISYPKSASKMRGLVEIAPCEAPQAANTLDASMYERGQAPDTHVHVQNTLFGGDVPLLGTSGGAARAASIATAAAAQVAATRQASTRKWRWSTARATRTQQRRNDHCITSCTARRHACTAQPARHLTRGNTRQTMMETMRQRRRRANTVAPPAHECCRALATTNHAHTTPHQRCAAPFAANEPSSGRFRSALSHTQTRTHARANTRANDGTRARAVNHVPVAP
jgi:hypothetical protein